MNCIFLGKEAERMLYKNAKNRIIFIMFGYLKCNIHRYILHN